MRTIIISIMLAVALCTSAYILNRNFQGNALIERIERVELDMMTLEDRYDSSNRNARRVIREVKEIVEGAYSKVIPVRGGLLAIKEEEK